jgi:predicted Zn finger-like uncharacterized protein
MKFHCPKCRADYQIADERVAGRSVKIGCRQCGSIIRVSDAGVDEVTPGRGPPRPSRPPSAAPPGPIGARSFSPVPGRPPWAQPAKQSPPTAEQKAPLGRLAPGDSGGPVSPRPRLEPPGPVPDSPAVAGAVGPSDAVVAGSVAEAVDVLESGDVDWYVEVNGLPVGPVPMTVLHARAEAGMITPDSLAWREGLDGWQPLREFAELLAVVEEARASAGPGNRARPLSGVDAASVGRAPTPGALASVSSAETAGPAAQEPGPARAPRGAWFAVFAALLLGLALGFALFGGPAPTRTVFKYVERRSATKPASPPLPPGEQRDEVAQPDSTRQPSARRPLEAGRKARARADGLEQPQSQSARLEQLRILDGPSSQAQGPSGPVNSPLPGKPLDPAQVQRTVARYSGSVKRGCWQPALGARDRDAPPTARVSVSLQVAPGGNVQSTSTSGDPRGYPGLASCIASRVRNWQFPHSGGPTTVNIPFVFAAQ